MATMGRIGVTAAAVGRNSSLFSIHRRSSHVARQKDCPSRNLNRHRRQVLAAKRAGDAVAVVQTKQGAVGGTAEAIAGAVQQVARLPVQPGARVRAVVDVGAGIAPFLTAPRGRPRCRRRVPSAFRPTCGCWYCVGRIRSPENEH